MRTPHSQAARARLRHVEAHSHASVRACCGASRQLIEERVYDIAAALSLEVGKNRMEALGEAQETADFFTLTARTSSASTASTTRCRMTR